MKSVLLVTMSLALAALVAQLELNKTQASVDAPLIAALGPPDIAPSPVVVAFGADLVANTIQANQEVGIYGKYRQTVGPIAASRANHYDAVVGGSGRFAGAAVTNKRFGYYSNSKKKMLANVNAQRGKNYAPS